MGTPRFRITKKDGDVVEGVVQGAGGPVLRLERLQAAQRLAEEGKPHGLWEPLKGCVGVFTEWGARSTGLPVCVVLVGAKIEGPL